MEVILRSSLFWPFLSGIMAFWFFPQAFVSFSAWKIATGLIRTWFDTISLWYSRHFLTEKPVYLEAKAYLPHWGAIAAHSKQRYFGS